MGFMQVLPHVAVSQHCLGLRQSMFALQLMGFLQLALASGLEGIGHPDGLKSVCFI